MTERSLPAELVSRFSRVAWTTIAGYAMLVILVFAAAGELQLRRSLERSADVIESLIGLYGDPEGSPTTMAPNMLADQLVGMGLKFVITRTRTTGDSGAVYFLSPTMPARRLEGLTASTPEEMHDLLLGEIAERARWRSRVFHHASGDFNIYILDSRMPLFVALGVLVAAALVLLPAAVVLARKRVGRTVEAALLPLANVSKETQSIQPDDLGWRIPVPTGQAEVTQLAGSINRMLERVEQSHRALESFTADASHELRSPLTHIRAQAQWALAEGRTPPEMHEGLSAISKELERMTKMVEDLLLIARGGNRQLPVERKAFELGAVVREVEEITQAMAVGRDVKIETRADGEVWAMGDADGTRHILLNLASNAVRYTPHGTVRFEICQATPMVGVAVRDTGPGIPERDRERIFDRFYRVEQSRSRQHGGTGLGLTIARVLAELQQGRITVNSEVGKGSSFTLWLPSRSS